MAGTLGEGGSVGLETRLVSLSPTTKYVRLNVGGRLFNTTVATLARHDCMLAAMVSGRIDLVTDDQGWILIDRDGRHFSTILNFLRDDSVTLGQYSEPELLEILAEARFYAIQSLQTLIQEEIDGRPPRLKSVNLLPYVVANTAPPDNCIFSSGKPSIKFLCNRQNNKYSYTNQSDEHLLRNIELFDKLAILFQGRLSFYKDIFGYDANEICQWAFYNREGCKRAEVCCASIVYATEKKNIKIDFPEAKIQEELIFLLANETNSDAIHNEVIRAMRCKHPSSNPV